MAMDRRVFIYFLVSLVLISPASSEEPICGSACAPRFDHDYQVLQKLADLETRQKSLEETITSQQNQIVSQQNVVEDLRKTLAVSEASQWSEWTAWGACFTSCSGNNGGRIQERSREATVHGTSKSEKESRPCNAVQFRGCVQTSGKNDNYAVAHDYADQMAQSTCTAILEGINYVFAVRRHCSALSSDCQTVCSSLGKKCFNALHVYNAGALGRGDTGTAGLKMYKYNNCGGGCGPNFCCCSGI